MTEQAVQDLVGKTAWAILQDGMPWQVHIYGYDRADRADPYRVFVYRKNAPVIPALGRPVSELARPSDCFMSKQDAIDTALQRIKMKMQDRAAEYRSRQEADRKRIKYIKDLQGAAE